MELTLDCQKRPETAKPNALRRSGRIPAVLYGHRGTESVALTVDAKAAELLLRRASVNNTLVQLNIPDLPWSGQTLLREVQTHPWKSKLYHLSFFAVAANVKITVRVPLHFVGHAPGIVQGGALDTVLTELELNCLPGNIPEAIEVDVSSLGIGDAIHVNELKLPEGVEVLGEPDRVVVSVLHGSGGAPSEAS